MRHSSEEILLAAMSFFALTGATAMALRDGAPTAPPLQQATVQRLPLELQPAGDASAWFYSVRQHCNAVEVQTHLRATPPPSTAEGQIHAAACYALAGRVDRAEELIRGLPPEAHRHAASVVFNAGHPAADAGDEVAAGPLMELVVEFSPNHAMALYHAGAARFELGDHAAAEAYLERFLDAYSVEDSWRARATETLEQIRSR